MKSPPLKKLIKLIEGIKYEGLTMVKKCTDLWVRLREGYPETKDSEISKILQKICSINESSVSRWRTGENNMRIAHAKLISKHTKLCVEYIINGTGAKSHWDMNSDDLLIAFDRMSASDREKVLDQLKKKN